MSLPEVSGEELIAWVEQTSRKWRALIAAHPEILTFACDIRETRSAGELLQHIVAVELRYAERLHGKTETPYEDIPYGTVEAIYSAHDGAMSLLHELKGRADDYWAEWIEFATRRGGVITVPRKTVFVHLLMHSIRHYAQLATLVRQHGISPDWPMDYIGMRPARALPGSGRS